MNPATTIVNAAAEGWARLWAERDGLPVPREPSEPTKPVGVWAGRHTINNPAADVAAAHAMGVTDIYLMVNDHSAQREPMGFHDRPSRGKPTASVREVLAVARECRRRGMCMHITTWVMPHEDYIDGLMAYSGEVISASQGSVRSVMLDAEEPWTRASGDDHADAAWKLTQNLTRCGVTGIGFYQRALAVLIDTASYAVPQCYLTSGGRLRPSGAKRALRKWDSSGNSRVHAGLAAYRTTPALMREGIDIAGDHPTIWWSLHSLMRYPGRAKVLREAAT